jgi:hypothetical protein
MPHSATANLLSRQRLRPTGALGGEELKHAVGAVSFFSMLRLPSFFLPFARECERHGRIIFRVRNRCQRIRNGKREKNRATGRIPGLRVWLLRRAELDYTSRQGGCGNALVVGFLAQAMG